MGAMRILKIIGDEIRTKKLIVKKGSSFLKAAPKWLTRLNSIQIVPTLEESVFNRKDRTLKTYTRNVSWVSLFKMHEKCIYKPIVSNIQSSLESKPGTSLQRSLWVDVSYGRINSIIERVLMATFRKSVKRTIAGLTEKLDQRLANSAHAPVSGRLQPPPNQLKDSFRKHKITFEKA